MALIGQFLAGREDQEGRYELECRQQPIFPFAVTPTRTGTSGAMPGSPRVDRGKKMLLFPVMGLTLIGCTAGPRQPDPFKATGEVLALSGGDSGAANACFTCHGLNGLGNGAGAPRLAGLDAGYLHRQLDDYANGRRRHAEMAAIARKLTSADRQAVSAYYADLPITPSVDDTRSPVPALYVRGDPRRNLAPCADCHGMLGEGGGPGNPPLAGQPASYLAGQLQKWRRSERRNDPMNIMLEISRSLTPDEIRSLAAYGASLPLASQRPEPPAASLSARRPDPRNDVSAPLPHAAE